MTQHQDGHHGFSARTSTQEQMFILTRAVEQSPNAILVARLNGVIEYINPSFTKLTGYTPEEIVGDLSPLSLGQTVTGKYRGLRGVLGEGRNWQGEMRGKKKNGESYWALETITPIHNPEGKIAYFLVIRQDITQQKLDHKALEESEERFRQVAEMTGEWIWEQSPEGRYLYSSAAVRDILGYAPEEIIGRYYYDFMFEEDRLSEKSEFPAFVEQNQGYCRLLNSYKHKQGHKVFTESTGSPLLDRKGHLVKWRGVDHNITARKHYEDALRLRNRAIEAASVGISILDAITDDFPFIYANSAFCKMTGYTLNELPGNNLSLLQGPDTAPSAIAAVNNALAQEEGCEVTLKNYRKNGKAFWNELLISPVWDDRGRLTHYICIQTDITEKKEAERQRNELDIARQIQLSLLPKAPLNLATVQVFGVCIPARHVGGDYFDYFQAGEFLDIVVADVSGHTAGSALMMVETRSSLKAEAARSAGNTGQGPAETLRLINELLHEDLDGADSFISLFYLRYHPQNRTLRYASAGHNPALLHKADAPSCESLDADGMIIGVRKQVDFEEKTLTVAPGDKILLYTDGLVEARNREGEFFDTHRLCRLMSSCGNLPPPQAGGGNFVRIKKL